MNVPTKLVTYYLLFLRIQYFILFLYYWDTINKNKEYIPNYNTTYKDTPIYNDKTYNPIQYILLFIHGGMAISLFILGLVYLFSEFLLIKDYQDYQDNKFIQGIRYTFIFLTLSIIQKSVYLIFIRIQKEKLLNNSLKPLSHNYILIYIIWLYSNLMTSYLGKALLNLNSEKQVESAASKASSVYNLIMLTFTLIVFGLIPKKQYIKIFGKQRFNEAPSITTLKSKFTIIFILGLSFYSDIKNLYFGQNIIYNVRRNLSISLLLVGIIGFLSIKSKIKTFPIEYSLGFVSISYILFLFKNERLKNEWNLINN